MPRPQLLFQKSLMRFAQSLYFQDKMYQTTKKSMDSFRTRRCFSWLSWNFDTEAVDGLFWLFNVFQWKIMKFCNIFAGWTNTRDSQLFDLQLKILTTPLFRSIPFRAQRSEKSFFSFVSLDSCQHSQEKHPVNTRWLERKVFFGLLRNTLTLGQ